MKKTIIMLMALLMLCSTAYADDEFKTITKEYEFTTESSNFDYPAEGVITESDIEYALIDIEYEVISKNPLYEMQVKKFEREQVLEDVRDESEVDFTDQISISEGGYIGTIKLNDIEYTERLITGRTASHLVYFNYGVQASEPTPKKELKTIYHDEETECDVLVTLQFNKIKKISEPEWSGEVITECMHRSIYSDEYLLNDGTKLSYNTKTPEYQGYEDIILLQLGLSNDTHRIVGSEWLYELSTDNKMNSRLASYKLERLEAKYQAVYSGSFDIPDMTVYDAVAKYSGELSKQVFSGTEYTVKVIAIYEEIPSKNNTVPIVVGTSSGVIALCGLIVFLKKRKRKKKQ